MKRSWLARHPVGFMALYSIFYLSVFHYLEANVPLRSILVHCRLDDLIPFCKYAVIPYFAWFVWIPFTLFYLLWKAPREDFWRLCLPLFSGMTIALACYAVLPTALDLRPYWVPGSDIFARVVRFLYRTDTATNVCPSIHVFNSVTLLLAYYRSRIFDAPRRRWMRPAAAVLCVSIVCSTVLLKQHSCIDVALGALLALVLDSAFTALERSQLPQVRRAYAIKKATPVSAFGAGRGRFFISFFRTAPRAGRYPAWGLLSTQSPAQGFPGCGAPAPAASRRHRQAYR